MEHIINFAISVEDENIKRRVQDSAYKDIISDIKKDILRDLPATSEYWNSSWDNRKKTWDDINWTKVVENSVNKIIDQYKEEIVDATAKKLSDRIYRTKALKETAKKVEENNDDIR